MQSTPMSTVAAAARQAGATDNMGTPKQTPATHYPDPPAQLQLAHLTTSARVIFNIKISGCMIASAAKERTCPLGNH